VTEPRGRYHSRIKGREYTPEERRIIEQRRKKVRARELERQRRNQNMLLGVIIAIAAITACVCIWYFGYLKPNDNYDAQMRIGVENYNEQHYGKAEDAFLRALTKRPNDPAAMIALADAYAAQGKYDEAIREMRALQGIDETDTRTYDRLITWYVNGTHDIESANAQIKAAYGLQLQLTSDLIRPAPTFAPAPGEYSEETSIEIRAEQGLTIYYTTDNSVPPREGGSSRKYEGKIALKNNKEITYTAAAYDAEGLMSWPAAATYGLAIKYGVDGSYIAHLGDTARAIMDDAGPLYYDSERAEGYCYRDADELFLYVFSRDDFTVEQTASDGAIEDVELDPERDPLPADAVCTAIVMTVGDYVRGMDGDLKVEDFVTGIGAADSYAVDRNDADGRYRLTWDANGARFDAAMKDNETVAPGGELVVRAA
jgi:tetratricopeptide (TPR) repeat protein